MGIFFINSWSSHADFYNKFVSNANDIDLHSYLFILKATFLLILSHCLQLFILSNKWIKVNGNDLLLIR